MSETIAPQERFCVGKVIILEAEEFGATASRRFASTARPVSNNVPVEVGLALVIMRRTCPWGALWAARDKFVQSMGASIKPCAAKILRAVQEMPGMRLGLVTRACTARSAASMIRRS